MTGPSPAARHGEEERENPYMLANTPEEFERVRAVAARRHAAEADQLASSAARDGDSEGLRDVLAETMWEAVRDDTPWSALGARTQQRCRTAADALLAGPLRQLVTERDEARERADRFAQVIGLTAQWLMRLELLTNNDRSPLADEVRKQARLLRCALSPSDDNQTVEGLG